MDGQNLFNALDKKKKKKNKGAASKSAENGVDYDDDVNKPDDRDISNSNSDSMKDTMKDLWNTPSLTISSWADCDDDDANSLGALPEWAEEEKEKEKEKNIRASEARKKAKKKKKESKQVEITLPELDMLVADEEIDDEDNEVSDLNVPDDILVVQNKDTSVINSTENRQLSKKELKKKEMDELESMLGELGIDIENDRSVSKKESQSEAIDGAIGESKTAAKKRRKAEREATMKALQQQETSVSDRYGDSECDHGSPGDNENSSVILDPAEAKRRLSAGKKKKLSTSASLAKAKAEAEAKSRASKKVKDKSNYNQRVVTNFK